MGLQITKETAFGVDALYFKIYELLLNFHDKVGRVTLFGYASKGSRDHNRSPLITIPFTFGIDPRGPQNRAGSDDFYPQFPFTVEGKSYKEAYDFIKTLPQWKDSITILEEGQQ